MADNMEADTFSGFKRRIKETPLHHFRQNTSASSSFSTFSPEDSQDITEKEDYSSITETSRGSCFEGNSVEVEETEGCEVGCVAGFERTLNDGETSLLSSLVGKEDQDFVRIEGFDKLNQEVGSVVEVECKENLATSPVVGGESNGGDLMGKGMESQALLEGEKSRMLTELEQGTIFVEDVHKDGVVRSSLKIEVIDDTALIECVPVPKADVGTEKKMGWKGKKEEMKQDVDVKKVKRSRRKAKDAKRVSVMAERLKNLTPIVEDQDGGLKNAEGSRKVYSRLEMEALRFVDIVEQKNLWRAIYTGLGAVVSNEYDKLANQKQKNTLVHFDPRQQRFPRKLEAPGILRERCSQKADNELEHMEDYEVENVNSGDHTCSHSAEVEDSSTVLEEECGEDYNTDEDYASIQRPAFLVEGEPDFDSGPPEDGLEYLRRVRWEAAHIPKVKVAKLGENKFNKEQSVYMPQIPHIAPCPEHVLPLKQWEDSFLADFSELRQLLSGLENSSAQATHKQQSLLTFHKVDDCRQLAESVIVEQFNKLKTNEVPLDTSNKQSAIDQPSVSNNDNGKISPCCQSPETSLDDSSNYPTVSAILRMDSVARVSMLRKRICSFETLSTLSRNDCVWLFALCAMVDTPLDADTCASLRSLLRKCASLRAGKSELDDEVVMLNILATLSGRYFGQSEA